MRKHDYSTELATHICNVLDAYKWHYEFDAEGGTFYFCFAVHSKLESANILLNVQRSQYVLYAILPLAVPTEDPRIMQRMCEFTVCANYGLSLGNFEMDVRDGELRYHTYVDCDGGQFPTDRVVRNSVNVAVQMLERYTDAILEILYGNSPRPVADIVRGCEHRAERRFSRQLLAHLSAMGDQVPEDLRQMIEEVCDELPQEDEDCEAEDDFDEDPED